MKNVASIAALLLLGLPAIALVPYATGHASSSDQARVGLSPSSRLRNLVAEVPDPQSAAWLKLFMVDQISPLKAASGQRILLIEQLPVAEFPDYDPIRDLDKVSILWRQTSGPPSEIRQPNTQQAVAILPAVAASTVVTFQVTVKNTSGGRTGELQVTVLPAR